MDRTSRQGTLLRTGLAVLACSAALGTASAAPKLDLSGYTDASGAITVQHRGNTVDPYFALQALWLAQTRGLDISDHALPWARWLAQHYTAAGHLGRYCKTGEAWHWCKAPDGDDASLALWLHLLRNLPASDRQQIPADALQARAEQDLQRLQVPGQGVYKVSPHWPHSLFMDNLEVWSTLPSQRLSERIREVFWDAKLGLFRVSTQAEHPHPGQSFYPDATAQIYPLLVGYPWVPGGAEQHYRRWMRQHRSTWLQQAGHEFPWGLIAVVAWQQGDSDTVRCWQQRALPFRHRFFWTVTDEVVAQLLPPLTPPLPNPKDCQ
jgi:hypothetical protein